MEAVESKSGGNGDALAVAAAGVVYVAGKVARRRTAVRARYVGAVAL